MKDMSMLVWLSQVGISVAAPPAAFIFCALWLQKQFGLGQWCLWVAIILGVICGFSGLIQSMHLMAQMSDRHHKKKKPSAGFNEHI